MRTSEERVGVLLAESGQTVGGTERVVWELATRLPSSRFDVRVWLSPSEGVDELASGLEQRGIAVDRVEEVDNRWDWKNMWNTWRRLRRLRPGLLHVHHVWPAADRYLVLLAGFAGVRNIVVTEHIEGHSHSGAQRALKRRELAQADAVTAVCGAVADALVRDYGVDRALVRLVANGADPPDDEVEARMARQVRQEFGATSARPLWVCAARLEEQKGHAVLLEALALLKDARMDFVLALAGEGSLRAALERDAAERGLSDHVHFLGQVEVIGPLLAAADAVVLPSRWEGMPLTLLEAMARGRPIVASAVGGIPEVMDDGEHGRLVPPGDARALALVLEDLHRRPNAAAALGEMAARRVRDEFTWQRVAERFEAVYDEVLGLASFDPPAPGRQRQA